MYLYKSISFFLFQKLCNEYTTIHLFILWLPGIYAVSNCLQLKQLCYLLQYYQFSQVYS